MAVRDSDEDTDDSLESMNDFFGTKSKMNEDSESSPLEDESKLERERTSMLKLFLNGKTDPSENKKKLRDILALKTSNKRTASKFLDHQRSHIENTRDLEDMQARYQSTLRDTAIQKADTVPVDDLLANFERHIEHEEDSERVMEAILRTEALQTETGYSFFGSQGLRDFAEDPIPRHPYPADAVPENLFRTWDDDARSRAYTSGMMTHLAGDNKIDPDAFKWTFKTFISEPDLTLRTSYAGCLEKAAPYWARTGIKPHDVQLSFWSLATNLEAMADSSRFELQSQPTKPPSLNPEYLVSTLDLFQRIWRHMSFESLSVLSTTACQIAIDSNLMALPSVAASVESLIEHLVGRYHEEEIALHLSSHIVSTLSENLHEPLLQARLLEHIIPSSEYTINIRITLANLFLLGVPPQVSSPFSASRPPQIDLPKLIALLNDSDDFATKRLRNQLNYADLRARIMLLDIAISDGGRPESFPSPKFNRLQDFNHEVDSLAATVRKVWSHIADIGASHMKRTEAKEKLDCVYHRLLNVVRSEPPKRKHVFDQSRKTEKDVQRAKLVEHGKESMQTFLARAAEDRRSVGLIKKEMLSPPLGAPAVLGDVMALSTINAEEEIEQKKAVKKETKIDAHHLLSTEAPTEADDIRRTSGMSVYVDAAEEQPVSAERSVSIE